MKVFFSASPRGVDEFKPQCLTIYQQIKHLGYECTDDDVTQLSYADFEVKMNPGRKAYVEWYKKKIASVEKADICIFETSMHSLGIGFLIQRALEYSKPVIALYYKDNIPYFLSGVEDEKLFVVKYDDKNLKSVIKKTLEQAREKRDKRFNFFLSPKLLAYIEKASNKIGVTKSKLLRDMILRHMREHEGETIA